MAGCWRGLCLLPVGKQPMAKARVLAEQESYGEEEPLCFVSCGWVA